LYAHENSSIGNRQKSGSLESQKLWVIYFKKTLNEFVSMYQAILIVIAKNIRPKNQKLMLNLKPN
jgi:hypothetical protein